MDRAMEEGKLTSKGGRIEYPAFIIESEIPVVEDFLKGYKWSCSYDPQKAKFERKNGSEKEYTRHYFNIKPLKK